MKPLLTFALAIALFAACQQNRTNEAPKPNPGADAEAVVQQYFQYFNQHDWAKMAAMYTDTAEMKDPSLGIKMVKQTRAQIQQKYTELHQMFPDVNDKVIAMYPSGKHVTVEFISTGTAPDGSKFELPICTVFTVENGKITQDFTYYDNFEG